MYKVAALMERRQSGLQTLPEGLSQPLLSLSHLRPLCYLGPPPQPRPGLALLYPLMSAKVSHC